MADRSRSPERKRSDDDVGSGNRRHRNSTPEDKHVQHHGSDDKERRDEKHRRRDDRPQRRDDRPQRYDRRVQRSSSRSHSPVGDKPRSHSKSPKRSSREFDHDARDRPRRRSSDRSPDRSPRRRHNSGGRGKRHIDWDKERPRDASPREGGKQGDRMAERQRRFRSSRRDDHDRDQRWCGDNHLRDRRSRGDQDRGGDQNSERDGRGARDRYCREADRDGDRRRGRGEEEEERGRDAKRLRVRDGAGTERRNEREFGTGDRQAAAAAPAEAPAEGAAVAAPVGRQRKVAAPGRAGGVYIPPFRLKQMMAEAAEDKSSEQYQRMMWEALRKTLNGIVNKVNATNIRPVVTELLKENLNRGQGMFCQALMKAQAASPTFTPVFAALVAVVDRAVPHVVDLLMRRLVVLFCRAYKRDDKPVCKGALKFIAHLTNQQVMHEITVTEILQLLLDQPTDDSIELAVELIMDVGAFLEDVSPDVMHFLFNEFRTVLQEGKVQKRTQFSIESLMATRKAGFETSGHPAIKPELDLLDEDDRIPHEPMEVTRTHDIRRELNVFKVDPNFEESELEWQVLVKQWMHGGDSDDDDDDDDDDDGGGGSGGGDSSSGSEEGEEAAAVADKQTQEINDMTSTDLVNLRRTLYLTLMSSATYEEAGHKLLKLGLPQGQEMELCSIIMECCAQEKTFLRFYALLAQRFCLKMVAYSHAFEDCFVSNLKLCHRLETNKLRNIAKLFAHLLGTRAISWAVLSEVRITEEDTTSASRIFYKYLFKELAENMSLVAFNEHLHNPELADSLSGVFPRDSMASMRFAINFFTTIGLGGITVGLRKDLKKAEEEMRAVETARALAAIQGGGSDDSSSSGGSSSSSGSGSSGSDSGSSSDSDSADSGSPRRRVGSRGGSRAGKGPSGGERKGDAQGRSAGRHESRVRERSERR